MSAHGAPGQGHEHREQRGHRRRGRGRRGVAGRGPRPRHPRRAAGAARRPVTPRGSPTGSAPGSSSARRACAARSGAGPEPHEPRRRDPGGRRAGGVPEGARRHGGRDRLRRAAQVRRVRPRHRRGDARRRAARVGAAAAAADTGAGVRDPAPRRRRRRDGHRVAQPAAGQRLQGLPRRRVADRPAGRRRDLGRDRGGRPARHRSRAADGWETLGDERARRLPRPGRRPGRPGVAPRPADRLHTAARGGPRRRARRVRAGRLRRAHGRCPSRATRTPSSAPWRSPTPRSRAPSTWRSPPRSSTTPTWCSPTTPTPTAAPWRSPTPTADGGWRMLRGDEVGALLAAHLVRRAPGRSRGTFAASIVSSSLLGRIAAAHGLGYARDPHRLQVDLAGRRAAVTATRRRSATASTPTACATRTASRRPCWSPSSPRP